MKNLIIPLCFFVAAPALAGTLQEQISAVAQAEQQNKAAEQRALDAQQEKINQQQRIEQQRRARIEAERNRKSAIAAAERKSALEKKNAEAYQDKKRNQNYEDELRNLELQRQKIQISKDEARAKRENDFIDQDIKRKGAETDVIQSHADVNRNISTGEKDLLQSEGKAREKKASGWFK